MDYRRVNRAVARLSLVATEDVPPRTTLAELCDLAADVLHVDGVGIMLADGDDNRFVHATSTAAAAAEHTQESLRSGPCRDAARTGRVVLGVGEEEFDRWPDFAAIAEQAGIGAVAALPLMSRGRCWGVLDLYREQRTSWDEGEIEVAQLLADVATSHLVMAHDRDTSRVAQSQLAHVSSHDHLTGLPNRLLLVDRLAHALESAPRRRRAVGVIFVDLDDFKLVNDDHGHRAGDVVLQEVAQRLSGALRGNDTVGRLAGDEFLVVCDDLPIDEPGQPRLAIDTIAERIRASMDPDVVVGSARIPVGLSLGAAVAAGGMTADDLMHEADGAMYRMKRSVASAPITVRDRTDDDRPDRLRAESIGRELPFALERRDLEVHYQPIVDARRTDRVVAVEALLRWRDRSGEVVPARAFIDVAVRRGLMPAIGAWVVDQVCAHMARWQAELGDRAPGRAYLNLSAREIESVSLPERLASACRRHGVAPGSIGLEIVEDNFSNPGVVNRLAAMRGAGHRLSIDDFGTGWSSLSRLFEIEVDVAKIDRDFVSGIPHDVRRNGFVDAVVSIAGTLGLDVVAEGVETVAQQQFLADAGCTSLQGYLFGRPRSFDDTTKALDGV